MRTIGPDSTKTFRLGTSLLALLPLFPSADVQRQPAVCSVAISVNVQAPLAWGAREWRLMTREVEQIWVPYGLSICWTDDETPCPGGQVRFRVLIEPDLPGPASGTRQDKPVLGRIFFTSNGPQTDIGISVFGARWLIERSTAGDRPLDAWPASAWSQLMPRVLGRALAHEIGHYMLQSRAHSRRGLMTQSFLPNRVTFGPTSWFRLTPEQTALLHVQCPLAPHAADEMRTQIRGVSPMSAAGPSS